MAQASPAELRSRTEAARSLAARLPDLLVSARRIAANALLGVHGRRRPGPGESFWQFRPHVPGEPGVQIDWRRSARDSHLYVREREWEASQTIWLWADLSPSMDFRSDLSGTPKRDRALVLLLALAELLGRGGERVGMPGLVQPRLGRDAADRIAAALMRSEAQGEWPRFDAIRRNAELVVIGDCLADIDVIEGHLRALAGRGAVLHLLQVLDPAEETFPFRGRVEFRDPESGELELVERAEALRPAYLARLAGHREALRALCHRADFSFAVHHTDRPAAEGLLALHARLSGAYSLQMTPVMASGSAA
jgi:uncharacterized protein (DUF58 family)